MKKALPFLLIILASCNSVEQRESSKEEININSFIESMQEKIDSGAVLYNLAINDVLQGIPEATIMEKYKADVNRLEIESLQIFERATQLGEQGKITQIQYDQITQSVFLDSIQSKIHQLNSYGINFSNQ
jgi:hypothetical protein